jgi:hypothetical protein
MFSSPALRFAFFADFFPSPSAMYVLTIKEDEYIWTFVGDDLDGQPNGRAGHQVRPLYTHHFAFLTFFLIQCALKGNQLVVVGGLTTNDVICEQPGVFVYNVSSSAWKTSYTANTVVSSTFLSLTAYIPRSLFSPSAVLDTRHPRQHHRWNRYRLFLLISRLRNRRRRFFRPRHFFLLFGLRLRLRRRNKLFRREGQVQRRRHRRRRRRWRVRVSAARAHCVFVDEEEEETKGGRG